MTPSIRKADNHSFWFNFTFYFTGADSKVNCYSSLFYIYFPLVRFQGHEYSICHWSST